MRVFPVADLETKSGGGCREFRASSELGRRVMFGVVARRRHPHRSIHCSVRKMVNVIEHNLLSSLLHTRIVRVNYNISDSEKYGMEHL